VNQKRAVLALKVVLWLSALGPAAWIVAGLFLFRDWLGANPTEKMTHVTGMTTLVLLMVTLSVSPLRRLTGWNPLIRLRRPLGLFAFFYVSVHFLIWFGLYNLLNFQYMAEDIAERPFITVGFSAFVILIPLAVTSTKGWIRRLGKRWTKLHMGVYVAATLGVIHFYWLVKADTRQPILFAVILVVLLILRSPRVLEAMAKRQRRAAARRTAEPARRAEPDPLLGESHPGP
jgi:sulfoxide reductase heme-binding subunit YedZ